MEVLLEIGSFAGKVVLVTLAIAIILIIIANLMMRARMAPRHLEVESLNERFQSYADAMQEMVVDDPKQMKKMLKARAKEEKHKRKESATKPRVFILDFEGDIRATAVDQLRDEITAVLTVAQSTDEIVVNVESTGGQVHTYGFAAAQLLRIRDKGIKLTVCVDKVAASGGYLMACTANQILATPFAILGSIGVVAQIPNINRLLKKHDVDFEEMTAGEYKRTVSLMGEITEKGRQKFLSQLEDTHQLFKAFVGLYRPQLNLATVATGEYWYGQQALGLNLCDRIQSSDDYLFSKYPDSHLMKVSLKQRKGFSEKIAENFSLALDKTVNRAWQKVHDETILRG